MATERQMAFVNDLIGRLESADPEMSGLVYSGDAKRDEWPAALAAHRDALIADIRSVDWASMNRDMVSFLIDVLKSEQLPTVAAVARIVRDGEISMTGSRIRSMARGMARRELKFAR